MNEFVTTKLNADSHLLLDQPLLKVPSKLAQRTFKNAQRLVDHEQKHIVEKLKATASASLSGTSPLEDLDAMIVRMNTLKRKLETLQEEESSINQQTRKRLQHLQDLYDIPSLADVKYDEWSRVRLNRLLIDYLLRNGFVSTARQLAREKNVEELVDVDAFVQCHKIEARLRKGDLTQCLNWCSDNKQSLKRTNSNLEIELRLQQYIELLRSSDTNKAIEATLHARKYFTGHPDHTFTTRAAGLLAFSPDTETNRYKARFADDWGNYALHPTKKLQEMYSLDRWSYLASLFVKTHHEIFSLPSRPPLQIALSAGLSALKTPSCHSSYASSSSNANSSSTSLCPICSTELNDLARNVPYAHHTKSFVENDPVVLPNGRIYGRDRLWAFNEKYGILQGKVRDPTNPQQVYDEAYIKKVFIS
ncbi:MAG: GID complex subunit containing RING finger motif [Bogoriella megaspora]|nr:MAG: GID complex subunit containing RING finger motif [Bogoriella megaspora]